MFAMNRFQSQRRRGATLVLICILMVVLIGMVAFAVDVGRMYLVRSQLQTAVDSGALAAALQLKEDNDDVDAAVMAADKFVQFNRVGWLATVPKDAITATAGNWDADTRTFIPGGDKPDSVQVSASADEQPLFFSSVLGHTKFAVPRSAIASASGSKLDVILTLDLSGSMADEGRIEALRVAAPEFLDVLEEVGDDDRVGVMGYGALPDLYDPIKLGHSGEMYLQAPVTLLPAGSEWVGVLESPLTDNFGTLRGHALASNTLIAGRYNNYTPTGAAIRDSAHYLDSNARDDVEKIIVLMSDGLANRPVGNGSGYAGAMANYAAGLEIKIYTISCGNDADLKLMGDIAALTGGTHFVASGSGSALTEELKEAFRHIASAIKRTQLVK